MKYSYKYVRFGGHPYPVIPIEISYKTNHVNTLALIDSGASMCVFKLEIANQLGINLKTGKKVNSAGVSGNIGIYIHKISVAVEKTRIVIPVGFSEEYTASFNLIGRNGFFNRFNH